MKRSTIRILALLLAAVMLLGVFAGCSDSEPAVTEAGGEKATQPAASGMAKSVTVGIHADIPTLEPYATSSVGSLHVMPEIYQTLFYAPHFGEDATPNIGKSYTISDDYLSCEIEIFDYVVDSAGNKITAEDVKFSFDTGKAAGNIKQLNQYYESCEIIDDYHVLMTINTKALGVWEEMFEVTYIVDSEAYDEKAFATAPIATGPYVVKEYTSGSSLVLEYNEEFWQTDEAYLNPVCAHNVETINYRIITENAQMTMALESGDIDLASSITATDAHAYFLDNAKYTVLDHGTNLFVNQSFNMSDESAVGGSLALRQAILYSYNVEDMIAGILSGDAERCYTWGGTMYGDFNEAWIEDYYEYDPELSMKLLDEAGYVDVNGDGFREQPDGSALDIRIVLETNDTKNRAAQYVQSCMQQVGLKASITQYDAALYSTYKTDFSQWDMIIDNQANRAYLASIWSNYLRQGYSEWNGQKTTFIGLSSDELQALIEVAGNVETNSQEAVDAVHQYIKDNALVYGWWCAKNFKIGQSGITDIFINSKMYVLPGACTYASDYQSNA